MYSIVLSFSVESHARTNLQVLNNKRANSKFGVLLNFWAMSIFDRTTMLSWSGVSGHYETNWPIVSPAVLPAWFDHLEESFSFKEVQSKKLNPSFWKQSPCWFRTKDFVGDICQKAVYNMFLETAKDSSKDLHKKTLSAWIVQLFQDAE